MKKHEDFQEGKQQEQPTNSQMLGIPGFASLDRSGFCDRLRSAPEQPLVASLVTVGVETLPELLKIIWAAAQGPPRTQVQSVVAITTGAGKRSLETQLHTASGDQVWQALGRCLSRSGLAAESGPMLEVRVIPNRRRKLVPVPELESIGSKGDLDDTADFIMETIQAKTMSFNSHVIACVGKGREDMGAILGVCMSMFGKSSDRLARLKVSEPFAGISSNFFFPEQPEQLLEAADGQQVRAFQAKVEILDIPFVSLRSEFGEVAFQEPTYTQLVQRYSGGMACQTTTAFLIDFNNETICVNGHKLKIPTRGLISLELWFRCQEKGILPRKGYAELAAWLQAYHGCDPGAGHSSPHCLKQVAALPQSAAQGLLSEREIQNISRDYIKQQLSVLRIWMRQQPGLELPMFDEPLHDFTFTAKS